MVLEYHGRVLGNATGNSSATEKDDSVGTALRAIGDRPLQPPALPSSGLNQQSLGSADGGVPCESLSVDVKLGEIKAPAATIEIQNLLKNTKVLMSQIFSEKKTSLVAAEQFQELVLCQSALVKLEQIQAPTFMPCMSPVKFREDLRVIANVCELCHTLGDPKSGAPLFEFARRVCSKAGETKIDIPRMFRVETLAAATTPTGVESTGSTLCNADGKYDALVQTIERIKNEAHEQAFFYTIQDIPHFSSKYRNTLNTATITNNSLTKD